MDLSKVITANIMASRKKESMNIKHTKSNLRIQSINSLPKELIGEISSFLVYKDIVSLSKVNRSIYVGCNF